MEFLSNTVFASIILSVIILITISYLLSEYEIETKDFIKLFLYISFINTIIMMMHKNISLNNQKDSSITAVEQVFNEITDSQQLNGIMPLQRITGNNEDELIIDNIPKSITCNNIVA